jgi:hypothetical protein
MRFAKFFIIYDATVKFLCANEVKFFRVSSIHRNMFEINSTVRFFALARQSFKK